MSVFVYVHEYAVAGAVQCGLYVFVHIVCVPTSGPVQGRKKALSQLHNILSDAHL